MWQEDRKIFVNIDDDRILLNKGEYVITEADWPINQRQIESIFSEWLDSIYIESRSDKEDFETERGEITRTDSFMRNLIDRTRAVLKSMKQG